MEHELGIAFGRKADLVERSTIERSGNYIRRRAILGTAQTIYAARGSTCSTTYAQTS